MTQWYYEYLDQIANLEFKKKPTQQGGTPLRYQEARQAHGDAPLCGQIAQALEQAISRPDSTVVLVTGTGNPVWLPKGETDGPPGVALLCRVFGALGVRSCVLTEAPFEDGVRRSVEAAGSPVLEPGAWQQRSNAAKVLAYPTGAEAGQRFVDAFLGQHTNIAAVFFIEKPGPNAHGIFHNSTGKPKAPDWVAHAHQLADAARARGILTVAVGDGGNEIGFGRLRSFLEATHPYGRDCGCPCKGGILNATDVDYMLPASVSNWGAYAIAAALCIALGRPDLMPEWDAAEAAIHGALAGGAFDGYTGLAVPSVDDVSLDGNHAIFTLVREVLQMARLTA